MNVFTRDIRGWHLGRTLSQDLTVTTLRRALVQYRPIIHHSDQGIQYAAPQYIQLLGAAGVQISMAAVGEPTQNGYAERVIRTIKEQEIALSERAISTTHEPRLAVSSTTCIIPSASTRRLAI